MKTLHNVKIFMRYTLFCDLMIIGPILVLFMQQKGLTFTQIMTLQSLFALSIVVLEVPTGVVADKLGRKHSLVMGSFALVFCLIIYMVGNHFWVFLVAEIFAGLGVCLKSGADSALLYDALKEEGRITEFQTIYGKGQSNIFITQAIGSLASSLLYVINPYLPYGLSVVFLMISGLYALQFIEPHCEGKKEHSQESFVQHFAKSSHFVLTHRKVFALTIFSVVAFTFIRSGFWFYQPYFQGVNLDVRWFGLCFFMFNLFAALGSKYTHLFIQWTKSKTLVMICVMLSVSFLGMAWVQGLFGILFISLQQVARGLYRPILNKYVNKQTASHHRATVLSFISLVSNLVVAIALPLFGLLYEKTSIYKTHLIMGVLLLVISVCMALYFRNILAPLPSLTNESNNKN